MTKNYNGFNNNQSASEGIGGGEGFKQHKRKEVDDWVRVEDALPPYNDKYYYWLYSESIDNYEMGDFNYDERCFKSSTGDTLYKVSHWMLPKPPKKL